MKYLKKFIPVIAFVVFATSFYSCKKLSSYDYPPAVVSAYELISEDNNYSYFKYIVDKVGLQDLLKNDGSVTIFVPTNAGFTYSGYTLARLQAMMPAEIKELADNHIITNSKLDLNTISDTQEVSTMGGRKIRIQHIGDSFYADGSDVPNINLHASNGYVHVINKVLITKPTIIDAINNYVAGNTSLSYLAAAIQRASTGSTNFISLLSGSTPYTLFAPTNTAFAEAGFATMAAVQAGNPETLGTLLKYHIVPGKSMSTDFDSIPRTAYSGIPIYFDRAKTGKSTTYFANGILFGYASGANLQAENGAVHMVARALPTPISLTTLAAIRTDASLTLFDTMLKRASGADPAFNFENMLSDPSKSYTVFAVSNAGMQNAGLGTAALINAVSPGSLADIVKYHLISKRVNNINIVESGGVNTLLKGMSSGKEVIRQINFLKEGGFKVQGTGDQGAATVINPNLVTTNGILNVIGSVLKP